MKILVVEDDVSMAMLCREELEDEGYEVMVADSGLKGLELFKGQKLDLVTLDIKLPDLDGMELLRQMKSIRPEVPVIILTAYDYLYDFIVCDADGYLVKSPDFTPLKAEIKKVLEKRRGGEKPDEAESEVGGWVSTSLIIREEYLNRLTALSRQSRRNLSDIVDSALRDYLENKL